jgi:phosphoribosyl 1,2-cyclic phosphodiesterase
VEADGYRVLVDCGFAYREMVKRLTLLEVEPESIDALLLTHEHGDHIRGAAQFHKNWNTALWMSQGTLQASGFSPSARVQGFDPDQARFSIGSFQIQPFSVSHDSRQPCQYRLSSNGLNLVVLTDLGTVSPQVLYQLRDLDGLILETNHDEQMLSDGPYPWPLKQRVRSDQGHLSNRQAAEILSQINNQRLQHLLAAHISEKNNSPEKARQALQQQAPELAQRTQLLQQHSVSPWFDLHL